MFQIKYLNEFGSEFSPLDLSPVLWLDASDASTITESGGAVSQWADKSGSGNHVGQGTTSARPITGAASQNGLNVLTFNGSQELEKTGTSIDSDLTIVSVFKVTTATSNTFPGIVLCASNIGRPIDYYDSTLYTRRTMIGASEVSNEGTKFRTEWASFGVWMMTYSKTTSTTPRIVEYVNNSETFNVSSTAAHSVASQSLNIGRRADNWSTLNGQVAEMFIFPTILATPDRTSLYGYLSSKWGL